MTSIKEINILIIGQSGAGKSTWINSFVNYASFDSFDEAAEEKPKCVIPTSFPKTDLKTGKTGKTEVVYIKSDNEDDILEKNECKDIGKSVTQLPMPHVIPFGDVKIRIIDTPGIVDTEGGAQDGINLDGIFDCLSKYKEVNCICFLLKATENRITDQFKYCLRELLTRFSKGVTKNLVFSFSHSNDGGDALEMLVKYFKDNEIEIELNEEMLFSFQNDSFKYLCLRDKREFTAKQVKSYRSSWDDAVEEMDRFMKYVRSLDPFPLVNVDQLHKFRKIAGDICAINCEISENIQKNIEKMKDMEKTLRSATQGVVNDSGVLKIPQTRLEGRSYDPPHLKCTGCQKTCAISSGAITAFYVARSVPFATLFPCVECRCMLTRHSVITPETLNIPEIVEFKDAKDLKKRQEQMEKEQQSITKASATLYVFSKVNAIDKVIDEYDEYLKKKLTNSKNEENKTVIEKSQRDYQAYQEILVKEHTEENMQHLTMEHIAKVIDDLQKLLINGEQIKNLMDKVAKGKSAVESVENHVKMNKVTGRFVK